MTFYVGQKVICILNPPSHWSIESKAFIKKGEIYIIENIRERSRGLYLTFPYAPGGPYLGRSYYNAQGFRPIVDKPTSIEIFEELLLTLPVKELETVK